MKHRLLYISFGLIILLGALHWTASMLYLYWTISWFDTMMHFLGGVSLGILSLWTLYASGIFKRLTPNQARAIITAIMIVLAIGVGWEIFENLNGLTQSTEGYKLDTIHDLLADTLGALVAGLVGSNKSLYE